MMVLGYILGFAQAGLALVGLARIVGGRSRGPIEVAYVVLTALTAFSLFWFSARLWEKRRSEPV